MSSANPEYKSFKKTKRSAPRIGIGAELVFSSLSEGDEPSGTKRDHRDHSQRKRYSLQKGQRVLVGQFYFLTKFYSISSLTEYFKLYRSQTGTF